MVFPEGLYLKNQELQTGKDQTNPFASAVKVPIVRNAFGLTAMCKHQPEHGTVGEVRDSVMGLLALPCRLRRCPRAGVQCPLQKPW